MEQFNSKLYAKYQNLKKRKGFLEDELNDKVDADIRNYQLAMEDFLEELKNQNDRLRTEIVSMQEQYDGCQRILLEERRKTKALSDEVGRLQNLLSQKNDDGESAYLETPNTNPGVRTRSRSKVSSKKKSPKSCMNHAEIQHEQLAVIPYASYPEEHTLPDCCRRKMATTGDASDGGHTNCVFQTLIGFLVGMKFSIDNQIEGLCLSVLHQRSGYNFSLTWVEHEDGGEGEFIYRVSSLGTLERVALDWMREDMVFSRTMCRVFFERISRVLGCR